MSNTVVSSPHMPDTLTSGGETTPSLKPQSSMPHSQRLAALRHALIGQDLDGVIIPLTDEHMSEYVGAYAKRLEWLTGFTGSAGSAIVLRDVAALFTDGRYTLQAQQQINPADYLLEISPESTQALWLKDRVHTNQRIAYDPWYHTRPQIKTLTDALTARGATLVPISPHPLDALWHDRPTPSKDLIYAHHLEVAGQSSREKRDLIAQNLRQRGIEYAVISALDSIAWLFNIRGTDVAYTPVARSYALLKHDGSATLYTEREKITPALEAHLGDCVQIDDRDVFASHLAALGPCTVLVDPETTAIALFTILENAGTHIVEEQDPCRLPKAQKNAIEIEGTRAAHVRDGAALTQFLHWLSVEAPQETVDELRAESVLYDFRKQNASFRDMSFQTIAGSGPNGAIVHYRVTPETNRILKNGELFLIDSGGQYPDGTTDVTRTVAIGVPSDIQRAHFTCVLKGHIALGSARFPKGTPGRMLDSLARLPLWHAGLDYDHGTGHGVGSFLSVHEGPQRIAKMGSDVPLAPGMIVSNEPGYYKVGAYGIRIENLVLVKDDKRDDDERPMLAFETLTLAPIDRALICVEMLTPQERAWLNAYHHRVYQTLSPLVSESCRAWLASATQAL